MKGPFGEYEDAQHFMVFSGQCEYLHKHALVLYIHTFCWNAPYYFLFQNFNSQIWDLITPRGKLNVTAKGQLLDSGEQSILQTVQYEYKAQQHNMVEH